MPPLFTTAPYTIDSPKTTPYTIDSPQNNVVHACHALLWYIPSFLRPTAHFPGVLIDADDIFTLRTQSGTVQPLTLTTLPAGSTLQLFPSGAGSLLLGQSGFGTTTLTAQAQTVQILSAQSMLVRATQELEIDSKDPTTGVQIATVSGGSVSGPVTISYAGQTTTIGGSVRIYPASSLLFASPLGFSRSFAASIV